MTIKSNAESAERVLDVEGVLNCILPLQLYRFNTVTFALDAVIVARVEVHTTVFALDNLGIWRKQLAKYGH